LRGTLYFTNLLNDTLGKARKADKKGQACGTYEGKIHKAIFVTKPGGI
jgi:hypothetical protein